MAISASLVKELREKTGVGMMECKKALTENSGDMDKAILWLRERGMSRAAKKAGRVAAEGLVTVATDANHQAVSILEVNCETDFASKNELFCAFSKDLAELSLKEGIDDIEKLGQASLNGSAAKDQLTEMIAKVGENMTLRRVRHIKAGPQGLVAGYTHMGGKIGTAVAIDGVSGDDGVALAKDIAMHIAAAGPRYLESSEVDVAELEQEKELARKKLIEQGKPENMVEKILVGQMNKFYKEICLVDQAFVKDPSMSITKLLQSKGKNVKITSFARFALGEGIEKKSENFADEVAAAMN